MKKYWMCIIQADDSDKLYNGYDWLPRKAAQEAIESLGITVINNWSGWGMSEKRFDEIMKLWNSDNPDSESEKREKLHKDLDTHLDAILNLTGKLPTDISTKDLIFLSMYVDKIKEGSNK